ncbi:MAG: hypothetical protein ACI4XB_03200 [Ruminococcus sp.]
MEKHPEVQTYEFKTIKVKKTVPMADRTLYLSEVDEDGNFYLDCRKAEKCIRTTIHVAEASGYMQISFAGTKTVPEKTLADLFERVKAGELLTCKDIMKIFQVLLVVLQEIDL